MSCPILLCHAKFDWPISSLFDFDRSISDHGWRISPVPACALLTFLEGGIGVIWSRALRARQAFALDKNCWPARKVNFIDKLCEFGILELLQAVRGIGNRLSYVIAIGHNPSLDTVLDCCFADAKVTVVRNNMQTSTTAVLYLPCELSKLQEGQARQTTYSL